jgi:protein gp37
MRTINNNFYTTVWNPLDGCLANCRYCRAHIAADRYGGHRSLATYMAQDVPIDTTELRVLNFQMCDEVTREAEAYPFLFSPTYHRHRLDKLPPKNKPGNILVCGSGDLFGNWVYDWIIEEVLSTAGKASHHNYLFTTKNPARYDSLKVRQDNMLFGATIDTQDRADSILEAQISSLDFLCIEPILTHIDLGRFLEQSPSHIQWVVVGAETGSAIGKVYPEREWLIQISEACAAENIPLFVRPGRLSQSGAQRLNELMGTVFRQEYPAVLQKNLHT